MAKLAVFVSVLLLLVVALLEQSESSQVKVCCTQYNENPIPFKKLRYYVVQDSNFCNIKAIIFVTVKNKLVCVNPDSMWVKRAMEFVPEKKMPGSLYTNGP
ncbi:C-C motif chemokine 17-like [Seriola lalandi dorsalis]|uniref:C-C motif chemokine 17-like n=1 Tax=Seriola lalandi dorsalis TaxID=1841481 RepID=UPI000C6F84BB|nr:C-C motif chemokine 17-like [Seriola lalandi dorsalis]